MGSTLHLFLAPPSEVAVVLGPFCILLFLIFPNCICVQLFLFIFVCVCSYFSALQFLCILFPKEQLVQVPVQAPWERVPGSTVSWGVMERCAGWWCRFGCIIHRWHLKSSAWRLPQWPSGWFHVPTAVGTGSIPSWGIQVPHAVHVAKKQTSKQTLWAVDRKVCNSAQKSK